MLKDLAERGIVKVSFMTLEMSVEGGEPVVEVAEDEEFVWMEGGRGGIKNVGHCGIVVVGGNFDGRLALAMVALLLL